MEVRVIGSDGKMLGVMSAQNGIEIAQKEGFDLVEIAPKVQPPTCKIMDYGKWKFDAKKKEKSAKKRQVKIVIKEIQIRPRTDTYDLEIKLKKAREFLLSGYKVKLHLRFSGREMAYKNVGIEAMNRFAEKLKDLAVEDEEKSKMERRSVFALFSPDPVKMKEYLKNNPIQKKNGSENSEQESEDSDKDSKDASKNASASENKDSSENKDASASENKDSSENKDASASESKDSSESKNVSASESKNSSEKEASASENKDSSEKEASSESKDSAKE